MQTIPRLLTVALLSALFVPCFTLAQEAVGRPPVYRAEENVTVTLGLLSSGAIDELARSKEVAGAAASDMTGQPVALELENNFQLWSIEKTGTRYSAWIDSPRRSPGGQGLWVTIRASIQGESSPDEAKKYVREVVTRLDKVLAELSRREYEQRRDQLKQAVDQAQESAQLARQRLDEVKTKLESVSAPVSETVLEGLVSDLKKQQQALELELAGIRGRTEALQKELAKIAERTKKEPAADEVLQNLRRVVELRRAQLAATRQLHEQGTVTSLEVGKSEEQVALAQIELAQAQRAVEKPNAEQMDKLTGELAQLAINRAENEAKLKFVTNRLDETLSALKHEVQSKPLRQQLEKQLNAVANLQAQADQATADLRTFEASFRPAHVEVLDLTPREPKDGEKSPQSK